MTTYIGYDTLVKAIEDAIRILAPRRKSGKVERKATGVLIKALGYSSYEEMERGRPKEDF